MEQIDPNHHHHHHHHHRHHHPHPHREETDTHSSDIPPKPSPMPSSSSSSSWPSPFDFLQLPLLFHIGSVLFLIWISSFFHFSSFWIFVFAFLYLFQVDRIYIEGLRRTIRSEERRSARQERPLSDLQSVHWLNHVIEKVWIHFLEIFISRDILGPIIPWFLEKFKPATVGKVTLQHLFLGRRPPTIGGLRILEKTSEDDHLNMELCLDFLAAEDMHAILNAQMRGLGISSNVHISKLQIEGKVRVGLKFTTEPPYLARLRLSFESAPYVQMKARPLSAHGVNVSEIPLISGLIDRIVADVFEKSLVEPNMLVVDVEKLFNSIMTSRTPRPSSTGDWFDIQNRNEIATVDLEILEALDLKAEDLNGLSDPFVKVSYATSQFQTKIEKNTLNPKWNEKFQVPILSWEVSTILSFHVYDKDPFRNDKLGYCTINLVDYRGGQFHDLWMPLQSVKTGRLHITVKVTEKEQEQVRSPTENDEKANSLLESEPPVEDKCEVVNLDDGNSPCIYLVSPGQRLDAWKWEQRSQKSMKLEKGTVNDNNEDADRQEEIAKTKSKRHLKLIIEDDGSGLKPTELISSDKIGDNNFVYENGNDKAAAADEDDKNIVGGESELSENDQLSRSFASSRSDEVSENSSKKAQAKAMAKGLMKHAGKTVRNLQGAFSRKPSSRTRN